MTKRQKIGTIAAAAAVLFFLMWNPLARGLILFLLPLGSGVDDLIFVLAAAIALGTWYAYTKTVVLWIITDTLIAKKRNSNVK